eukprot:jgi/Mesvir1/16934/Mv15793-RA.1
MASDGKPGRNCRPVYGKAAIAVLLVIYMAASSLSCVAGIPTESSNGVLTASDFNDARAAPSLTRCYLQTRAVDSDEGPFVRLTKVDPAGPTSDPKLALLHKGFARLAPLAAPREAGAWTVERLCGYQGILEPETTIDLPKPADDYPPFGCVDAPTTTGATPVLVEGGAAAVAVQGGEATAAPSVPVRLDESFVAFELNLPGASEGHEGMRVMFVRDATGEAGQRSARDGKQRLEALCRRDRALVANPASSPDSAAINSTSELGYYVASLLEAVMMGLEAEGVDAGSDRWQKWAASGQHPCVWHPSGSSAGARFLNGLAAGEVTKKDVEIVIAQHSRGVEWSDVFAPIRTIYYKGDHPSPGSIWLDNMGRETHSFLTHIVRNYDNLAENTIFLQDHRPGISHIGSKEQQHFHARTTLMDYLLSTRPLYMVVGDYLTSDMSLGSGRLSRVWNIPLNRPVPEFVSDDWSQGGQPLVLDTWLPPMVNEGVLFLLGRACSMFSGTMSYADCYFKINDYWREIALHSPALPREPPWELPDSKGAPGKIFFAQGGVMAVSRDAIRRHPRAFYENLISHLSISIDPIAGFYTEMSWYYIFKPGVDQRDLLERHDRQLKLAGIRVDMSVDEVMRRLVLGHAKTAARLKVPRVHQAAIKVQNDILRRQLAAEERGGFYSDIVLDALLAVKETLFHAGALDDWVGSIYCNWTGILCVGTDVTSIDLSQSEIAGTINRAIGELTTLRSLDLSGNYLSGVLPSELGNLTSLESLSLSFNSISGFIPSRVIEMTNLLNLTLNNNNLAGIVPVLPPSLGPVALYFNPNLCGYPLSAHTFLPGSPLGVGETVAGTRLLMPCSPDETAALQSFSLGITDPHGALTSWVGDNVCAYEGVACGENGLVSTLQLVDLELVGDLSTILPELPAATTINLSFNSFGGTIPARVTNLINLQFFLVSNNNLMGTIPVELSSLPSLSYLDLGGNTLSGTIPPQIGQLRLLEFFSIKENSLISGTIPPQVGNLLSLQTLLVNGNSLSGTLPPTLGVLLDLQVITLDQNPSLTGCIPDLVNLNSIDLAGTGLSSFCVNDVVPPLITCPSDRTTLVIPPSFPGMDCPPPGATAVFGVSYNRSCTVNVQNYLRISATDNVDATVSLTYTPTSFQKGAPTLVTWTARDSAGNTASCTRELTLVSLPELVAIEVTQAVQDWSHSVPLVAGKATLVRAFVQLGERDTRTQALLLNGVLTGSRAGVPLGAISKVNLENNLVVTKNIRAARGYVRGAFQYLLPETWLRPGPLTVCFVPSALPEFPDISPVQCNEQDAGVGEGDCCVTVQLRNVPKPCFRFIRVSYIEGGSVQAVSNAVLREQWRRFRSMLPIPADSVVTFRDLPQLWPYRPPLRLVNNVLDAARIADDLGQRCWYVGVLKGAGGGLAELNGETSAYYVGSAESSFACGYERNRGVHEFLHNMGIEHVRQGAVASGVTACTTIPNENPVDYPFHEFIDKDNTVQRPTLGPMSNYMTEVFGTDPVLAATGAPSVVAFASPRFVFALMSYCQPLNFFGCQGRWIDSSTYATALNQISERAVTGPPPIGRDTPKDAIFLRGTILLMDDNSYKIDLAPVIQICSSGDVTNKPTGSSSEFNVDLLSGGTSTGTFNVLETKLSQDLIDCNDANDPNCAVGGKSNVFGDFSQDFSVGGTGCVFCFGSFDLFTTFSFDAFPTFSFDFLPQFSFDAFPNFSFDFLPQFSFDGFPYFSFDGSPLLLFDGWPQFSFDLPSTRVSAGTSYFVATEFQGFAEEIAPGYSDFDGTTNVGDVRKVEFQLVLDAVLPRPNEVLTRDASQIQFSFKGDLDNTIIETFSLSATAPVLGNIVKYPLGDVATTDDAITLCYDISDADVGVDAQLTSTVQYCPDVDINPCSCELLTVDHVDVNTTVNTPPRTVCQTYERTRLKKSTKANFRVYVSDGLRNTVGQSAYFTVPNNAPNVAVVFPTNGSYSAAGDNELFLKGTADDFEDGLLTNCSWFEASNPAHPVFLASGVEASITTGQLRRATADQTCISARTILLVCFDSEGAFDAANVTHTVAGTGIPPRITCPVPIVNVATDAITCAANVTFPTVTAVDSCSGEPVAPFLLEPSSAINGSIFPVGDTVVTYRASEFLTRAFSDCSFVVRVSAPPSSCFRVVGDAACNATCINTTNQGSYIVQFTAVAITESVDELTEEQVCSWNIAWGVLAGVDNPADPCEVSSSEAPPVLRRRSLQQANLIRVTRMYFDTAAAAEQAAQLIAAALANNALLAQLRAIVPIIVAIDRVDVDLLSPAGVTSDPHFQGPCGQRFDFMGAPGESFCLMTSKALHLNGKMTAAVAPASRAGVAVTEEGSKNTWIQELGILYGTTNITISAQAVAGSSFSGQQGRVFVNGTEIGTALGAKSIFRDADLLIERRKTRVKLTLGRAATLQVEVVRAAWWEAGKGPGGNFLNLKVLRLANTIEWDGVLGQMFGKPCNVADSIVGDLNVSNYRTSGVLSEDCAVSNFKRPSHSI